MVRRTRRACALRSGIAVPLVNGGEVGRCVADTMTWPCETSSREMSCVCLAF